MPAGGPEVESCPWQGSKNALESPGPRPKRPCPFGGDRSIIRGGTFVGHFRLRLLTAVATLLALSFAGGANAAPSELFFSEYIEGSSNNKALEIYNGTGAPINLGTSGYSVQMFFNGSATAGLTINLTGTVAAGDVYVLAQSAANAAILAQADQTNGCRLVQRRRRHHAAQGHDRDRLDRPDRLRPRDGVGHRPHEHRGQHAPPQVADRGGRRERLRRLRPGRRVGRFRDRQLPRARGAPRPAARAGADRREHDAGGRGGGVSASTHPCRSSSASP